MKWLSLSGALCMLVLAASHCGDRNGGNRLANSTSRYLREHADNPVDWFEWGPEAFQKAKAENKPLLISIGYAACHWCHVMEEESFMDTAVSRYMNENFVSIKVDREQRPDIDQIYINAAQIVSGSAGWPLNAFALPDGKPFYAGTYFPKEQWMYLLRQIRDAYEKERKAVISQADALTDGVQSFDLIDVDAAREGEADKKDFRGLFKQLDASVDRVKGGLKGAPKFPMPVVWEFALQHYFLTGDKKALEAVTITLDHLARGGIYDHVGGGFARYATDNAWKVPHFEKMLYDNAQLVSLYSHAFQLTGNPLYRDVIEETISFVHRELTDEEGGFYSSVNADSEGVEGKFYVWRADEIAASLGEENARLFIDYYNVRDSGNWEDGKNILFTNRSIEEFSQARQADPNRLKAILADYRKQLLAVRDQRIRPSTDDKVITSWNALMQMGYVDAFAATGQKEYLDRALKNADFIRQEMLRPDGSLWRSYSHGKSGVNAFLDDYALLARAWIRLYEVTFDVAWLNRARSLADYAIRNFLDQRTKMFYYTSGQSEGLVVRTMEVSDQVIPSSNSVMSEVLLLLGDYYQDASYGARATEMLARIHADRLPGAPAYHANWARVSAIAAWQPFEVAVVGKDALDKSIAMQRKYNPLANFSGGTREDLPLLENKLADGKTVIYVCRNRVCKLPVEDVAQALEQLRNF